MRKPISISNNQKSRKRLWPNKNTTHGTSSNMWGRSAVKMKRIRNTKVKKANCGDTLSLGCLFTG
jgi:hypothetical protein